MTPSRLFGFEWFLHTLLDWRLLPTHRYTVRMDHNSSLQRANIPGRLVQFSDNVEAASLEDSKQEPLIQLADILTGCVAASYNAPAEGTRAIIEQRFRDRLAELGVHDLKHGIRLRKVNVWVFRPNPKTSDLLELTSMERKRRRSPVSQSA
jgi:hypothetical protein